jgi:hypothetical protein
MGFAIALQVSPIRAFTVLWKQAYTAAIGARVPLLTYRPAALRTHRMD